MSTQGYFESKTLVCKKGDEDRECFVVLKGSCSDEVQSNAVYTLADKFGRTLTALHEELELPTDTERFDQYTRNGCGYCPYCLSNSIEAGAIEVQGASAHQSTYCLECNEEWQDIYAISAIAK